MTTRLPDHHPNLSPELNARIADSMIEGGADLRKLGVGKILNVRTKNTSYRIERVEGPGADCPFLLSGHPRICPEPTRAGISGSTFGRGGMLRMGFIGRGMHMEFHVERENQTFTTSEVVEVEEDRPATTHESLADATRLTTLSTGNGEWTDDGGHDEENRLAANKSHRATKRRRIRAADLFCGAGGSSSGLRRACEQLGHELELTAINHWPTAIETHRTNDPEARHICEELERVNPRHVFPGGHLDLLIASPECTHHSRARGGRPVSDQQRASAWIVLRWAEALYIRSILIENVPEFTTWGPLDRQGRPVKHKAGQTYNAFLDALRSLGYHVDTRILNAADYGDPTTRRRLFIVADRRRRPRWPAASHRPDPSADGAELPRWRGAGEIIDWSIPGRSIFTRAKPLAPATLRRIEAGIRKLGGPIAEPFIVILRNHSTARSLDQPVPTITTSGAHLALCEPFLLGQQSGAAPRRVAEPAPTIATGGAISLIEPFIFANRTNNTPKHMTEPVPTLCTGNHIALVEPQMQRTARAGRRAVPRTSQAATGMATTGRPSLVRVNGTNYQLDIRFRMLLPHELAQAQGFASKHQFCGTRTDQVRQIGNAVPVATAEALCAAVLR